MKGFLASIHLEYLCFSVLDILILVFFNKLPVLCPQFNLFHPIHTIIAELLSIVGIEIVVAIKDVLDWLSEILENDFGNLE